MRIEKKHLEAGAFILLYIFTLYLWTLPFQKNRLPYGEFDAISHWEIADAFAKGGRTFVYLPNFIDYSYWNDNKFKPHTLWYHPPFHTALAIVSSFVPDRVVSVYFANAVLASSILISVFFVIRKLFGFLPAILSSFMLSFSMRDINPYLWGQWPERFAYAFVPLILYCFYKYFTGHAERKGKPIYLYLVFFFLALDLMAHPLIFFHSVVGILVLAVLLFIKLKKIPLEPKHIIGSLVVFLILVSIFPYQTGNVIKSFTKKSNKPQKPFELYRLLQWAPDAADFSGSVPPSYFSFREMHGLWTLPFLIIGIIVLLMRRDAKDIFLLSWLVSLYLILHRDAIGKAAFLHRSLSGSAHIFIPITVLGALAIPSFVPSKKYRHYLKYLMAVIIVVLTLAYNFQPAYGTLKNAYGNLLFRINGEQIGVSEWLKSNIPEDKNVSIIGPPPELMEKVWWIAAFSHRISNFFEGYLTWKTYAQNREQTVKRILLNDYIVVDYSDISLLSDKSLLQNWQAFEKQYLSNHTLLYNKGNVRVYKYEK